MNFLEQVKKIFGNRKKQKESRIKESSINKDKNQESYEIYHEDEETEVKIQIQVLAENIKWAFNAPTPDEENISGYNNALKKIKSEMEKRGINAEINTDSIFCNLINELQIHYNSEKKEPVNYDEIKKKLEEPLVFEWGTGNEETTWRHFCNFNYEDIINKTKLKAIITRELDECYEILGDECLDKDFGELVMIRGEFASLFGELNKIINDYSKIISEMVIRNDYKVTDEKLKEYYEFLNIQPQIHEVNEILQEVWLYADQNIIGKRLEKYSKDDAFMKKLQTIMEHDTEKHKYLFHGTQVLEDSPSILENGLLMMRKDLGSTTVKEMTQEELLLYERRRNDGKYWNRICCNN